MGIVSNGAYLSDRRRIVRIPDPVHAIPIGLENPSIVAVVVVVHDATWLRLLVALHHLVVVIRGHLLLTHESGVLLVLRVSQVFARVDF